VFHRIDFPAGDRLRAILHERLGHLGLGDRLVDVATARFEQMRGLSGWDKKPSTAELIAWVRVLHKSGIDPEALSRLPTAELPFAGALAKTEQDTDLLARTRS
jgi:MoxR-like ATPase